MDLTNKVWVRCANHGFSPESQYAEEGELKRGQTGTVFFPWQVMGRPEKYVWYPASREYSQPIEWLVP